MCFSEVLVTSGPLDLNRGEVEELNRILFPKWSTASATVTPWAAHSRVSWGYWEQAYLRYWGSIWGSS